MSNPESPNSPVPTVSDRLPLFLAILRIVIGWHFLYEGVIKVLTPGWTSEPYLKSATGPLAQVFRWMGHDATFVRIADPLNVWALILIGLALMLGYGTRVASFSGIGLLALYYLAHPPLFSPLSAGPSEGSYLVINKNIVELCALAVVAACSTSRYGIAAFFSKARVAQPEKPPETESVPAPIQVPASTAVVDTRRAAMASVIGVPFLGAFVMATLRKHGWKSFEEAQLVARRNGADAFVSGATLKNFKFSDVSELKGKLPTGKIGNLIFSRMILGGNLMGGWAHARDLIYVSKLVKAYHHRDKVFETLAIAEKCGINAILTNPLLCEIINDYWRVGGRIRFISDCGGKDVMSLIQRSIDHGACACYIQGAVADKMVREGQFDQVAKALELMRKNKVPAGIGGHYLATIQKCVERGLIPDFWMKTLHSGDYWSATPTSEKDNIWCEQPEETIAYMHTLPQPWIAYKVLAAGAIEPKVGFQYAFENGADFVCVGMYDFQIVDDVNIALGIFNKGIFRKREWCA